MGLIDCFVKTGLLQENNEKAKQFYLGKVKEYKDKGLNTRDAERRVVMDLRENNLMNLHNVYYQLRLKDYPTLFKDIDLSHFITKNGSRYVMERKDDGWITRRYHLDEPEKRTLDKDSSEQTIFIKPEYEKQAQAINGKVSNNTNFSIEDGKLKVFEDSHNSKAKATELPYEEHPQIGYHPLSILNDGFHLGSRIETMDVKPEDLPSLETLPQKELDIIENKTNQHIKSGRLGEQLALPFFEQATKEINHEFRTTQPVSTEQSHVTGSLTENAPGTQGTSNAESIQAHDATNPERNSQPAGNTEGSTGRERQDPQASATEVQGQVSGIKKSVISEERNNLQLKKEDFQRLSDKEVMEIGKSKIESGEIDPKAIVTFIAEGKARPLTAEETAALVYYKTKLDNDVFQTSKKLNEAILSKDAGDELVQREKLKSLNEDRKNYFKMSDKSGYEQSQSFRLRKLLLDSEFNAVSNEMKYRAANEGNIPATVKEKFEKLEQDYKNLQEEMKNLEEMKAKRSMSNFVEETKTRAGKIADIKEARQQAKTNIIEKLKAQRSQLNSNPIPVEIIPDLVTLAKTYIQEGFLKGEEIIDKVYEDIKDHIIGITRRDLRDAISGYGKEPQQNKDELIRALNDARKQMKLLSAIEDASKGETQKKSSVKPVQPSTEVQRLKKELDMEMSKAGIKRGLTDEQKLQAFRARTEKAIEDYSQRLDKGDFSKRVNNPLPFTDDDIRLKAKLNKIRNEFEAEHLKLERSQRSKFEKVLDFLAHLKREMVISSITTIGKLATAGTLRMVQTPWENLNGQVLHMLLPGISKKALMEGGGFNPRAELAAVKKYGSTWGQLFKGKGSMVDTIKEGKSELDNALEEKHMSEELVSYVGRIHGALKDPVKQAEFIRAMKIQTDNALKNKIDLNNPVIQKTIVDKAYIKARSSIFTNPNMATEAYRNALSYLEYKGGTPGKVAAFLAKLEMPVVTVPTNFANEILKIGYGSVHAMSTIIYIGAKNLSPENADYVMSCLKKQGIGIAMYTLGYLGYQTIGGYYTGKRKTDDPEPGSLEILGIHLPHWAIHSPMLEPLQMGATLKHMELEYERKGKEGGTMDGLYQATTGALRQIPFIETPKRLTDAIKNKQSISGHMGDLVKSEFIPPDVQKLAAHFDMDENGKPIKRNAKGFTEHIETGIPGLRENVGKAGKIEYK